MRIEIDWDLCQGHAMCEEEAPEVFRVLPDGTLEVLQEQPPPELHAKVRAACTYCPTGAIKLVDDAP
ncbi:MAG: ferredoxin [Alphaproteobacteria bacterium]|nr:ferredoxin [Alphaproteobacteria bacterium]